jgi:hypothetical protein
MDGDASYMCPVFIDELSTLDKQTEEFGKKISFLEEQKGVVDAPIKQDYFMLEARSYLLSEKVKSACGSNYSTILYFYSNKNCANCDSQGKELSKLKASLGEGVRIYSFDGELDSPIVTALMLKNSVTAYPSVVVNSNSTQSGLMTKDEILALMR